MNWTECEKELERIIREEVRLNQTDEGFLPEEFVFALSSQIASWIDTNFGLHADQGLPPGVKHHHEGPL